MANVEADSLADISDPGNQDDTGEYPENITRSLYKMMKKLMNDNAFNCKSCGLFFKTAVYSVSGTGVVCQNCVTKNNWQGERLEIFTTALEDLPAAPCSNAGLGCKKVLLMPADVKTHLEVCEYRQVGCISSGCIWRGKQDDLAKHFEETHQADVIGEKTAFGLDLAEESFAVAKLLIKNTNKYFLRIRREPNSNHASYSAFRVEKGYVHSVDVTHCCDSTGAYFTKRIDTEHLNTIDKACTLNKINLMVLKEISEEKNELFLTAKATKSKSEEMLSCSGCKETMRIPIYQCKGSHSVCDSCFSKVPQCPVCQRQMDKECRNDLLEAMTSDLYYSCVYQPVGCEVRLSGTEIEQHESNCGHANFLCCPLLNCSYRNGSEELFQEHVGAEHKDILRGNSFQMRFDLKNKEHVHFKSNVYYNGDFFQLESNFKRSLGSNSSKQVCTYRGTSSVRAFSTNKRDYLIDVNLSTFRFLGSFPDKFCKTDILIPKNHTAVQIIDHIFNVYLRGAQTEGILGFTIRPSVSSE